MKYALSLLSILLFSAPVYAQSMCAERDKALDVLAEKFGERVVWRGITTATSTTPSVMLELLSNPETGTWTLITVTPEKLACLKGSGAGSRKIIFDTEEDGVGM
jgi:hypothetical protein